MQKTVNHFVRAKLHYTDSGVAKGGHGCMPPPPRRSWKLAFSLASGGPDSHRGSASGSRWGTSDPSCPPVANSWLRSRTRTPATNTRYGHQLRTPPTDKLTTILQQICYIAMPPEPNISTCPDVGMWQIFVSWWCPLVVSVSGICCRSQAER